MRKERCAFCDKPATVYCDYVLGFDIAGWTPCSGQAALNANRFEEFVPGKGLPYMSMESRMFTCDAPACDDHAIYVGPIFYDGDTKHTRVERVDICCLHKSDNSRKVCITAEQADRVRLQTWQRAAQLKVVRHKEAK